LDQRGGVVDGVVAEADLEAEVWQSRLVFTGELGLWHFAAPESGWGDALALVDSFLGLDYGRNAGG
jgi:hypothetical protein